MTEPSPLTDRQSAILAYLRTYIADHGYPPTVRETGAAVGLASSGSVSRQIGELAAKGYLRREPGSPRAITILDPAAQVADKAADKDRPHLAIVKDPR